MNPLEQLDVALLRLFNVTWSNPFFDWLMPELSGKPPSIYAFIALVAVAVVCLFRKGGARGRVALLVLAVALAFGDGLVCNNLKHLIGRQRPCWVVEGINVLVGKSRSGAMPSAHAFNWAVGATALFLYYRRSLWVMGPLALGVGFSRIYNGVHYPGDVLAGFLIGIGYTLFVAWVLDWSWQRIGPRWFPRQWAALPSLRHPERTVNAPQSHPRSTNAV